ncbi:hypothetical protein AAFC00_006294 [Neodothiora populina]|uniref:Queuine tRNA-ribosyltransferase accessory subunit 2 n=1 Tax=Neodothiora populina TaxID=2781224 RepID=A0ABR3P5I1_9PEZI
MADMPTIDGLNIESPRDGKIFSIKNIHSSRNAARLGLLRLPDRKSIQTPHYIAVASRGVVPHLSPDNYASQTDIRGVYMALEDFIERKSFKEPPIYKYTPPDDSSPLRRFTGLPDDSLLVLGPRRTPPISCPTPSTLKSIPVLTSVGYRHLECQEYSRAAARLRPDIVVGLGDVPYGADKVPKKKIDKITDRSTLWMREQVKARKEDKTAGDATGPLLYAPILPISVEAQRWYLDELMDELKGDYDGLALYDTTTLDTLPTHFGELPRLGFTEPKNPNAVLREVSLGMDILTVPFIGAVTDAGIAFDFSFPVKGDEGIHRQVPQPLGVDMWDPSNATSLTPLSPGCFCYACTNHHKAYLQHLLMAKEMLGWVLLQIHNHHVMDLFFDGIRNSIARDSLEEDTAAFHRFYESDLPAKTGQGPRVRGYQFKAEGPGQPKANPSAFKNLDDIREKVAQAAPPTPSLDSTELEAHGFAEKTD